MYMVQVAHACTHTHTHVRTHACTHTHTHTHADRQTDSCYVQLLQQVNAPLVRDEVLPSEPQDVP